MSPRNASSRYRGCRQREVADAESHAGLLHAVLAERDAALQTLFGERAVVVVVKQQARGRIAGDIDVGPSVVVEIRGHGGEPIAASTLPMPGCAVTSVKVPSPLLR